MGKKIVLITGASGGIGRAIVDKFLSDNYHVIYIYNSTSPDSKLKAKKNISFYKCNLLSTSEIEKVVQDILTKFKKIDVLINSAGVSHFGLIQDINEDEYYKVFDSNVKSIIFMIKHVVKSMISEKCGSIINISSMWGKVGSSMESIYSASKGAINTLTLSLAKELGPSNIRVNAICPGLIDTKMNSSLTKDTIDSIVNETPLLRMGTAEDVANLCLFLASENSSFITGQLINVDGGFSI